MCHYCWILKNSRITHIDSLVQKRCNIIANALELRVSCSNPSICWCHTPDISHLYHYNDAIGRYHNYPHTLMLCLVTICTVSFINFATFCSWLGNGVRSNAYFELVPYFSKWDQSYWFLACGWLVLLGQAWLIEYRFLAYFLFFNFMPLLMPHCLLILTGFQSKIAKHISLRKVWNVEEGEIEHFKVKCRMTRCQ